MSSCSTSATPQAPRHRVEQRAGADDPAADDDDVPRLVREARESPDGASSGAAARHATGDWSRQRLRPAARGDPPEQPPGAHDRGRRSASGVWKTTRWQRRRAAGSSRPPRPSTTATTAAATSTTSRQPGCRPAGRASATVGLGRDADRGDEDLAGVRRAHVASARPVFGRWKVTVRSARTAGSDGSPLERSTAVGVSTATTGTPAPARAHDELDGRRGSARAARRGRRSRAGRRR